MSIEFLQTDFDKVSYLANLLTARATGLAADEREFIVLRHELLSNQQVAHMLPHWLRQHRSLDSFWSFIKPKFSTYAERRTFISEEFTAALDSLEFGTPFPEPASNTKSNSTPPEAPSKPVTRNKRKVFIVHGRDNAAKQEVSRFIEKLGIDVIILHEQASSGMTIIEKSSIIQTTQTLR